MKRTILMTCAAGLMSTVAAAQQAAEPGERRAAAELAAQQVGAIARVALETRVTRGKPYSGEAVTEFVQVLSDGNRIVRRTATKLYRDSDGRTRRETLTDQGAIADVNSVVITDPVAGTSLILDAGTKTVFKAGATFAKVQGGAITMPSAATVEIARSAGPEQRFDVTAATREKREAEVQAQIAVAERGGPPVTTFTGADGAVRMLRSRNQGTKEDLGEQMVEGVMAKGTRTTTVVPAGAIGNEQPITTVSEQWFSSELDVLVLTKHSDPRVGDTTYRLTNITRSEPDRSLFQAPPDYTVQERLMLRRQP